jgi:hypothetical protein
VTEPGPAAFAAEATRERARDGLDHLQAAARELINAARAALDVAESLIDDPEVVSVMVGAAGRLGDVLKAVNLDRSWGHDRDNGSEDHEDPGTGAAASPVERITIR